MHIYFDESGGLDRDWMIMAGVLIFGDERRNLMESKWQRRSRKGRKWSRQDFEYFVSFLREHGAQTVGCFIKTSADLRSAYDIRAREAERMGIHIAHGSSAPLRPSSLHWQHMAAGFVSLCMASLALVGVADYELSLYPDRLSMPEWQINVLRQAFALLDGRRFGGHVADAIRGQALESAGRPFIANCRWEAPRYVHGAKSSRLMDLADAYCALGARFLQAQEGALELIEATRSSATSPLLVDMTAHVLWRAKMNWLQSAQTFVPGPGDPFLGQLTGNS